jgi:peptidyl-prolyl cis-trans isomerase SurA
VSHGRRLQRLALVIGLAATSLGAIVDRIAAVVNDEVITLSEVYELGTDFIEERVTAAGGNTGARRQAEIEVLDTLIMRRLISQEIEKLELDVGDTELDRTIDDIARRNGLDRDQLRAEVEKTGMPWQEYRNELKENLRQAKFTQAVIQPRINVNEDELIDAYRRLTASGERPQIADLGAIFLAYPPNADDALKAERKAAADQVRAEFATGKPFAELAQKYDQGPYGPQGGKMGTYKKGELVPELDVPAFSTPVGSLSAPIETSQGVFLLTVFELRTEAPPPMEEMRESLMQQVYADRIDDETDQWYRQARRRAAVLVKLEAPE